MRTHELSKSIVGAINSRDRDDVMRLLEYLLDVEGIYWHSVLKRMLTFDNKTNIDDRILYVRNVWWCVEQTLQELHVLGSDMWSEGIAINCEIYYMDALTKELKKKKRIQWDYG
jgi:hypothetical protein